MKYIDAELLRKEIKRRIEILKKAELDWAKQGDKETSVYYSGKSVALDEFTDFIDSIQQEQPEVNLEAEKDLALTWKDMKRISRILDIMVDDDFKGKIPEEWGEEEYYKEVLRRFNKEKEE